MFSIPSGDIFGYRSQLASIVELDDRILSDIGLSRSELRTVAWNSATQRAPH